MISIRSLCKRHGDRVVLDTLSAEVKAGETVLTSIEPSVAPLLDPRARQQAEALVSLREASRQQASQAFAPPQNDGRVHVAGAGPIDTSR